jgi:altronate dehydratase
MEIQGRGSKIGAHPHPQIKLASKQKKIAAVAERAANAAASE